MNFMQVTVQNPEATEPLIIPVLVVPNTSEEVANAQIKANCARDLPWLDSVPAHDKVAVIVGGGPSVNDFRREIADLAYTGATVFGLNAAACWCVDRGIPARYQIILDAKQETSALAEPYVTERLYASQVHPDTAAYATMLFSLANVGIEDLMPPWRVVRGGYTLVGGGVSVGITALTVAYTLGYRRLELFGYDSSNRDTATHAYPQRMNSLIPQIDVPWGGKTYRCAMPMKLQAEAFPKFARALIEEGCEITVHGDGLLPAMWSVPPLTEREKYQLAWAMPSYRQWSPGEDAVEKFIEVAGLDWRYDDRVIDFGCGTGRAALKIAELGHHVTLVDFTDNCRDQAAFTLPFLQWDLTQPIPFLHAPYGYCTDVMEHIPTKDVPTVIHNIMAAADSVFFMICTTQDGFGKLIGQPLHLTVKPHDWWLDQFEGYRVTWQEASPKGVLLLRNEGKLMAREIPHPHLYIEFYMDAQKDKRASREQGRPIFKDVEMVHIRIIGDPTRDLRAPAHEKFIQAPKGWRDNRALSGDWDDDDNVRPQLTYAQYYREHYAAFQEMKQTAEVGTPIEMLPFMSKRRQAELKAREVRTVEGLASLPDRLLKDCGPSTRDERDQAKAWLDQADQAALVAASRERETALEARLAAMQAQIEAMGQPAAGPAAKADDPETWDDADLRAFIAGKGLPNPRANASHDKLVAAVRDLMVEEPTVEDIDE